MGFSLFRSSLKGVRQVKPASRSVHQLDLHWSTPRVCGNVAQGTGIASSEALRMSEKSASCQGGAYVPPCTSSTEQMGRTVEAVEIYQPQIINKQHDNRYPMHVFTRTIAWNLVFFRDRQSDRRNQLTWRLARSNFHRLEGHVVRRLEDIVCAPVILCIFYSVIRMQV